MLLESIKYNHLPGKSKEFSIEGYDSNPVHFGNFNLIVGNNSAGKTQTLGIIREVANLFSGYLHLSNTCRATVMYVLTFKDKNNIYEYILKYENRIVVEESLHFNGELKVDRLNKKIYSEKDRKFDELIIPESDLSISLHNIDAYPYLKKLYIWGASLRVTIFSNQLEKRYLVDDMSELNVSSPEKLKEQALFLYSFYKGREKFGSEFVDRILQGMQILGYPITKIDICEISKGYGIGVLEGDDEDVIDQLEMSQGMFRALSFLVYLNLVLLKNASTCILVDDLGEGLDYNRSNLLIDLLIKNLNLKDNGIQLFITTNDRYIMNKTPLEYWSVIERRGKKSVFFNYNNSKSIFDDFKYTGLNNFDFLSTGFYEKGFGEAIE